MDRATKSSALGFGQPDRVLAYHKSVHSKMWMPRGNVIYGCGYQMDAAGRINSETPHNTIILQAIRPLLRPICRSLAEF